ncbi:uncharacterized protein LOC112524939 [Cynara cardunculus var. scolymus]|uniref:uncharacterized protein LOC112524939 n=1 Tax=Cynara cardunculus var. scolymus TaxID=59895 RepID=UPI000D625FDF|nr:uncharacterized protein LOC112524939 [Cynara cardunculus var. scolymus]
MKANGKSGNIKDLVQKEKCSVLGLQETKCDSFFRCLVCVDLGKQELWLCLCDSGRSGSILLSWDDSVFFKESEIKGDHFCGVVGLWQNVNKKVGMINVYNPQAQVQKTKVWEDLSSVIQSALDVIWVILGDFNAVRFPEERMGSNFDSKEASDFNNFISSSGLLDINFCGRRFTRFSKDGSKMSKLDRFLVTSNFFSIWKDPSVQVLHRSISDHCPILLKVNDFCMGPKPFRGFDSWLGIDDFQKTVLSSWSSTSFLGAVDFVLKEKVNALKKDLRIWSKKNLANESKRKDEILKALFDWDSKAEKGGILAVDCQKRDEWIFELMLLENRAKLDIQQKSRSKWALEGDENSKFFHNFVNYRRRRNNIKGIICNGVWNSDPLVVKSAFL